MYKQAEAEREKQRVTETTVRLPHSPSHRWHQRKTSHTPWATCGTCAGLLFRPQDHAWAKQGMGCERCVEEELAADRYCCVSATGWVLSVQTNCAISASFFVSSHLALSIHAVVHCLQCWCANVLLTFFHSKVAYSNGCTIRTAFLWLCSYSGWQAMSLHQVMCK